LGWNVGDLLWRTNQKRENGLVQQPDTPNFRARTGSDHYFRHIREIRKQINTNNQTQVQLFTYLLHQQDGGETENYLKPTTKLPISAKSYKSIGNSNDYGQLKSISNNSDN